MELTKRRKPPLFSLFYLHFRSLFWNSPKFQTEFSVPLSSSSFIRSDYLLDSIVQLIRLSPIPLSQKSLSHPKKTSFCPFKDLSRASHVSISSIFIRSHLSGKTRGPTQNARSSRAQCLRVTQNDVFCTFSFGGYFGLMPRDVPRTNDPSFLKKSNKQLLICDD